MVVKLFVGMEFTHPVFATLDHPLFAARKEGKDKLHKLFYHLF